MEKINSLESYKEIVTELRKKGYKLSNCYFLPDMIRQKTAAGSLYFLPQKNYALFLDDQDCFYRCYYFLTGDKITDQINLDKDAVVEFPFNGEINERQLQQVEKIKALGFQLGRKSGMMAAVPEQIIREEHVLQNKCVAFARTEEINQIRELLNSSFNPLYAFLPNDEELVDLIWNNRVFVIRNQDTVDAVLISSFEKNTASIRQVVVQDHARGNGLGKALMEAYHRQYMNDAVAFQHWVDLDNARAIHMYQSFGYRFNLRKANEYILLKERI